VSVKGKRLEIFVEDTGTGIHQKTAKEMTALLEERRRADPTQMGIRGRGLSQIVSSWTDLLEFTDNEKGGLTAHVMKNVENES